jgi:DNA-binding IscR family transcriptional regulator
LKNSTRFAVAIHVLVIFALDKENQGKSKLSSEDVARSVNTNPVVIRRIMTTLKKAGLLVVRQGASGAFLSRAPNKISLFDIYQAVKVDEDSIFKLHEKTSPGCPVGSRINDVLRDNLNIVERKMEKNLGKIHLSDIVASMLKSMGNTA